MRIFSSPVRLVCVVCFLSCFVTGQSVASNITSNSKTTQAHLENKKMKLEELIQNLEDANPWTVEKVSKVLGVKLTLGRSKKFTADYHTNDYVVNQFNYGEGLIIDEAVLQINIKKGEAIDLTLKISKDAVCFKHDYIKKTYPSTPDTSFNPPPNSVEALLQYMYNTYQVKRSWGSLLFRFKHERPDCLAMIHFVSSSPKPD